MITAKEIHRLPSPCVPPVQHPRAILLCHIHEPSRFPPFLTRVRHSIWTQDHHGNIPLELNRTKSNLKDLRINRLDPKFPDQAPKPTISPFPSDSSFFEDRDSVECCAKPTRLPSGLCKEIRPRHDLPLLSLMNHRVPTNIPSPSPGRVL